MDSEPKSRREFLRDLSRASAALGIAATGAGALAGCGDRTFNVDADPLPFTGSILGANAKFGHLLRDDPAKLLAMTPELDEPCDVAIVGAGIAGLSAAWRMKKAGFENFRVLELEDHVGGNATSGKNDVSAYPWGAHYVPLPNPETTYVYELFADLGILEGHDAAGAPIYNEYYLCRNPQERLFIRGQWQENLEPRLGITATERAEFEQFFAHMDEMKSAVGNDGKRAFAIPLDLSSADPRYRDLDRLSMAQYLEQRGWTSPALHWYVNYSCRDDYGIKAEDTSAWAGVHYFASRTGTAANATSHSVLTWPAGNGWLVEKLRSWCEGKVRTAALVFNITAVDLPVEKSAAKEEVYPAPPVTGEAVTAGAKAPTRKGVETGKSATKQTAKSKARSDTAPVSQEVIPPPAPVVKRGWAIDYLDAKTGTARRVIARSVVLNVPQFVAGRLLQPWRETLPAHAAQFTYAPWMVANLTVDRIPRGHGFPPAWDNVIYRSDSLGYVTATHQNVESVVLKSVLTYYWPLSHLPPKEARLCAYSWEWDKWARAIMKDLQRAHPEIVETTKHLDVWLWGHAMIRPVPGFLWGGARSAAASAMPPGIFGAHSDMSGISIFEEAQYQGVTAADRALAWVKREKKLAV